MPSTVATERLMSCGWFIVQLRVLSHALARYLWLLHISNHFHISKRIGVDVLLNLLLAVSFLQTRQI